MVDPRPVVWGQLGVANVLGVDPGLGAENSLAQLQLAHLERKEQYGKVGLDPDVGCQTQREGGLSHCGAAAHDDERVVLEAREQNVEVLVASFGAGDTGTLFEEDLEAVQV